MLAHLRQIPRRTNSLVQHPHAKVFIAYNFLAYGFYKWTSGPTKNNLRKNFTIEPGSSPVGLITAHLLPTNLWSVVSSSALIYTVGNRHLWKYGATHFWTLALIGAVGGSLISKASNDKYSGLMASASAITFYNAVRNPAWFMLGAYPAVAAMLCYSAYYQDRAFATGGLAGYLAFLLAL